MNQDQLFSVFQYIFAVIVLSSFMLYLAKGLLGILFAKKKPDIEYSKGSGPNQEPIHSIHESLPKPPCSKWDKWIGAESEGHTDIGKMTVFVRKVSCLSDLIEYRDQMALKYNQPISRVWFCIEFRNWDLIRACVPYFDQICVAVSPTEDVPPWQGGYHCRLYVRIPMNFKLRPGDYVAVGPDYHEEMFEIGTGDRNTPELYKNDSET
jgi:hypothetical protein